jgi:hypothetical protein
VQVFQAAERPQRYGLGTEAASDLAEKDEENYSKD